MACAVVAMSMMAGAAQAGDWRLVNNADSGAEFLDVSAIQTMPTGKKKAWTGIAWPRQRDGDDYMVIHNEFDCAGQTHRMLAMYIYDGSGRLLRSGAIEESAEPVAPDSNNHGMFRAVCLRSDYGPRGFVNMRDAMTGYRGFRARN